MRDTDAIAAAAAPCRLPFEMPKAADYAMLLDTRRFSAAIRCRFRYAAADAIAALMMLCFFTPCRRAIASIASLYCYRILNALPDAFSPPCAMPSLRRRCQRLHAAASDVYAAFAIC